MHGLSNGRIQSRQDSVLHNQQSKEHQRDMTRFYRSTFAEIDLRKIKSNYLALRSRVEVGGFFCPMVKANAYGHGDVEIASILAQAGATHMGVGLIEEGVRLRDGGIKQDLLMYGIFDRAAAKAILDYKLTPVLSMWEQIRSLKEILPKEQSWPVHIKFNTGMNRLGFALEEAQALSDYFKTETQLKLIGVCTHMAIGEDIQKPDGYSQEQLKRFQEVKKIFQDFKSLKFHAHNSSALMGAFEANGAVEGARPGIALYGVVPPNSTAQDLSPAMSLYSQIVITQKVKKGARVSYGGNWTATRDSTIGVVCIGYGDGYSRFFSNKGVMLCRGQKVPVLGTVCMDYTMVDLTDVPAANSETLRGESVLLFGRSSESAILDIRDVSALIGTIPYEIITCIGRRVPRSYIYD
jgi:alanine racemase